jgi:AcrR family transcriptional regulator
MPGRPATTGARFSRLAVDARREQLVQVGMDLFAHRRYEDIGVGEIAAAAGISRGLLYHYFPTKRDFFVAVVRTVSAQMHEAFTEQTDLPPLERLRADVDNYLDVVERGPSAYRTLYRTALGSDHDVRAIIEESQAASIELACENVMQGGAVPETLRIAVRGWIGLVITLVLDWLDDPTVPRDTLRDILVNTFFGILAGARAADPALDAALPAPPTDPGA